MNGISNEEKFGIFVDVAVLLFLPLMVVTGVIYWWLSIVTPTSGLEAIISALPISAVACVYFLIVFYEIMDGKTLILGLLYMNKRNQRKWDEIKHLPFPVERLKEY